MMIPRTNTQRGVLLAAPTPTGVVFGLGGVGRVGHVGPCSSVRPVREDAKVIETACRSSNQSISILVVTYTSVVPKLWTQTIETHRREVRDAILDTTAALVAEHGLLAVTMSQIAEQTGIGRATLYKYFPDVEAILRAWHQRQITAHLAYLADVRDQAAGAGERLEAVLEAYALLSRDSRGHHDTELAALLHRDEHVARVMSSQATASAPSRESAAGVRKPRSVASCWSPWLVCARRADAS